MPFEYVKRSGERGVSQGIYLPRPLWDRVNALAAREERTRADMMRRIIQAGLRVLERRRPAQRPAEGGE